MGSSRALHRRLAERLRRPVLGAIDARIYFMHLPKCGGTSLHRALRSGYAAHQAVQVDAAASRRAAELAGRDLDAYRRDLLLYFLSRQDLRYVSGHLGFSEAAAAAEGWSFVTLLREPVARWFSHFFYNRYKADEHFRIHEELADFVESERGSALGRLYLRSLGGGGESLSAARAALDRFALVGCLERLADFVDAFERRFGVRLGVGREQVGPGTRREREVDAGVRRRVEALCEPDRELYRYALERVEREAAG